MWNWLVLEVTVKNLGHRNSMSHHRKKALKAVLGWNKDCVDQEKAAKMASGWNKPKVDSGTKWNQGSGCQKSSWQQVVAAEGLGVWPQAGKLNGLPRSRLLACSCNRIHDRTCLCGSENRICYYGSLDETEAFEEKEICWKQVI